MIQITSLKTIAIESNDTSNNAIMVKAQTIMEAQTIGLLIGMWSSKERKEIKRWMRIRLRCRHISIFIAELQVLRDFFMFCKSFFLHSMGRSPKLCGYIVNNETLAERRGGWCARSSAISIHGQWQRGFLPGPSRLDVEWCQPQTDLYGPVRFFLREDIITGRRRRCSAAPGRAPKSLVTVASVAVCRLPFNEKPRSFKSIPPLPDGPTPPPAFSQSGQRAFIPRTGSTSGLKEQKADSTTRHISAGNSKSGARKVRTKGKKDTHWELYQSSMKLRLSEKCSRRLRPKFFCKSVNFYKLDVAIR